MLFLQFHTATCNEYMFEAVWVIWRALNLIEQTYLQGGFISLSNMGHQCKRIGIFIERIVLIALMMYFLMKMKASLDKLDQQGFNLKHSNLIENFLSAFYNRDNRIGKKGSRDNRDRHKGRANLGWDNFSSGIPRLVRYKTGPLFSQAFSREWLNIRMLQITIICV